MSEKNKKGSTSSAIILILGVIGIFAFIFYLPSLQDYYRKNFKSNDIESKKEQKDIDTTAGASDQYIISEQKSLTYNDITIENVTYDLSSGYITNLNMDITSKKEGTLEELNYYIEFYNSNNEFITRRMLKGKISKKPLTVSVNIAGLGITESNYFIISHISDSGIPNANLNVTSNGTSSLLCSRNRDTYRYTFDNKENADGIISKETVRREVYSQDEEESVNNRLTLQKKVNKYNGIDGLTASMVEDPDYLVFLFEVDYSKSIDLKEIDEDYVFGSGTNANIIKFKMEAEGFACNG